MCIDEERRKFLKWMNPGSCIEKHNASSRQRNPKIGHWIFDAKEYKDWNNSDYAFLWLNGQPGHGKTILASSIINKIRDSGKKEPQTLSYFYCNFQDDRTTNAAAVFRSLIVQLLQQSERDWITQIDKQQESKPKGGLVSLRKLWQQNYDAKPHPTDLELLRKLLVEASALVYRPVLVIDALDECKDYPDLIRHLEKLPEDARLRLFVTSRSMPDVQDAFHDLFKLSLKDNAGQMEDMRMHIKGQLENQKHLSQLSDALKKTILKKLLEKAEGMFRWVQCQLDEIVAYNKLVDIEATLDNVPAGLYETYDRIIQAIKQRGPRDDQIAHSCLLWLAGVFTPLTLDQLKEAMMIEVGQSELNPDLGVMNPMDILAACGSLVDYNEKTRVVTLFHNSVKEYLITRPNSIFKSISDMHTRICKLLITYVLYDFVFVDEICAKAIRRRSQSSPRDGVSEDHPLLSYAIQGWKHLSHVSDEDPGVMTALSRLNSKFLRNNEKHPVLAPGEFEYKPRGLDVAVTSPSLLFILLEHGKPWMVEPFVEQCPHLLHMNIAPDWGSPLIFVIAKNPDCLSILLKFGVDLKKSSSFKPGLYGQYTCSSSHTPISWAAVTGSEVAVDFLLSRTEVKLPDDIMYMAVKVDKPSHESIRKFRERGANVDFKVNGSTPIHHFLSTHGSSNDESQLLPVVKALVEPSCNLSLQDRTARTVLHIALDARLEKIVAYLLQQNAGLSATAALDPDMWRWATNKTWFPNLVRAAALAADQLHTRIMGNVVHETTESKRIKFSVAATADRNNADPVCAIVISAIFNSELSTPTFHIVISHFKRSKTSRKMIPPDSSSDLHGREGSVCLVACSTTIREIKLPGCYSS
ncbi:uncharacterized protein BJ212DRAFT_478663 [Suillus subaureus]|uniref:NACHT domain-containing protein n=1 Tax=Suillus subaureus TaxID=48587 RepID=A0A9P7E6M2_9AGAM|nr:uncharacterized protein BJ212DRAFT_478663 [Suillus subaureus]KAG1812210.1 hypothetical protein BJ212DRAFT_478663 [Suillus subaureus]